MKLSASLIVKNEKDHIEAVLKSLAGFDEIVVCDTGSTDNTVELARKYTPHVFTDYTWNDHFAEARNHALSKCTGDWVLSIDGDEVLEEGGLEKIKAIIAGATEKQKNFSVRMTSQGHVHYLARLFKREGTEWVGRAHETIKPVQDNRVDLTIYFGHSTAHKLDPFRMMRILQKSVEEHPESTRDKYYLAREYYYRKDYARAIPLFEEYVKASTWNPEKSDGYLYLSRCYFYSFQGDKARTACAAAIIINPDFREALLFMAELHYSPWKEKWLQMAELASNKNVMFVRAPSVVTTKIPKKLHHIWVGPKNPPLEWMQTWRDKNPDWEYTLWDNEKVFGRTWRNQKHVDFYREKGIWHGVADVVRYEILHEQGGFMPGADSVCENSIDDLFSDGFEAYGVYENEKVRPGLVSPLYACAPDNRFAELLIAGLTAKETVGEPWIDTGNTYMMKTIAKYHPAVKIFPSYVFNPVHYTGETYRGEGKIYGRQKWGTTLNAYGK